MAHKLPVIFVIIASCFAINTFTARPAVSKTSKLKPATAARAEPVSPRFGANDFNWIKVSDSPLCFARNPLALQGWAPAGSTLTLSDTKTSWTGQCTNQTISGEGTLSLWTNISRVSSGSPIIEHGPVSVAISANFVEGVAQANGRQSMEYTLEFGNPGKVEARTEYEGGFVGGSYSGHGRLLETTKYEEGPSGYNTACSPCHSVGTLEAEGEFVVGKLASGTREFKRVHQELSPKWPKPDWDHTIERGTFGPYGHLEGEGYYFSEGANQAYDKNDPEFKLDVDLVTEEKGRFANGILQDGISRSTGMTDAIYRGGVIINSPHRDKTHQAAFDSKPSPGGIKFSDVIGAIARGAANGLATDLPVVMGQQQAKLQADHAAAEQRAAQQQGPREAPASQPQSFSPYSQVGPGIASAEPSTIGVSKSLAGTPARDMTSCLQSNKGYIADIKRQTLNVRNTCSKPLIVAYCATGSVRMSDGKVTNPPVSCVAGAIGRASFDPGQYDNLYMVQGDASGINVFFTACVKAHEGNTRFNGTNLVHTCVHPNQDVWAPD